MRELGATHITTVGYGPESETVDAHFVVPVRSYLQRYAGYLIRGSQRRFRYFFGRYLDQVPPGDLDNFDLIVVNEIEYVHWAGFSRENLASVPVYLDLHEDHVYHADRGLLERFAFRKYWAWQLQETVSFVRSRVAGISITSVEEVIAESYSQLFSMSVDVIYNAPDRNDLRPTPVQADAIRLVHHGMGTKGKGIEETICALNFLDSRYSLDLILFATPQFKLKIELLSRILGVRNRINILRGVPLSDLPLVLNRYDVAIVLLSDVTPGHWNSLPNKLFESIHSKLAIVTGPNPSMRRIVEQGRVGVALPSWSPKALSAVLSSWTASDIWKFKENTTSASAVLSSDQSKVVFARIVRKLEAEAREGK